jgi:hypothetical protein
LEAATWRRRWWEVASALHLGDPFDVGKLAAQLRMSPTLSHANVSLVFTRPVVSVTWRRRQVKAASALISTRF